MRMYLVGLIGLAAIAAPFVLGFNDNTAALYTNIAFGVLLVVAAGAEIFEQDRDNLEYWVAGILGVGAIAAPFVLGFDDVTKAFWTTLTGGVLAVLVAGTRIFRTAE